MAKPQLTEGERLKRLRKARKKLYDHFWRKKHPDYHILYKNTLKGECFSVYGLSCEECGESNIDKLGIVLPKKLRNKTGVDTGKETWGYLKNLGYPTDIGIKVLCFSCARKRPKIYEEPEEYKGLLNRLKGIFKGGK